MKRSGFLTMTNQPCVETLGFFVQLFTHSSTLTALIVGEMQVCKLCDEFYLFGLVWNPPGGVYVYYSHFTDLKADTQRR